ncbi:MAG: PrsW family intramembrane metalloprotease [Anaerolineaceae bacterium]|nr:PrsW family intramembrane metalloprotease [Anaerolineaceae bacterium]
MSTSGYLIPPPIDSEEVQPRQPVWRSLVIQQGALFALTAALYVAVNFIGIEFPAGIAQLAALLFTLIPLGLWLLLSWRPEQKAIQPRQRLIAVAVISALVANAIAIPMVQDFFQVDRWLPLGSAINRIIGYSFTAGVTYEILKYLVIRYTVWPDDFHTRFDSVAYSIASAIGFSTVLNLYYVISNAPPLDIVALRVFETVALQVATSLVVGYALAELRFSYPTPLLLPSMVALAAFINGVAIPIRAGLVNAAFSLEVSGPKSLFGMGFALALLIAVVTVVAFLLRSAERQSQEAAPQESGLK